MVGIALTVSSQTINVTGTVTTDSDNEPVVGATVHLKGSNIGTSTDVNGHFSLNVPSTAKTLTFSYVGLRTRELPIEPVMNVKLTPESTLDEVVVTGYGQTRKAAFTGAASVVESSVIDRKPDVNFVKSLEGNVTGFQYNNSTSMPGQWGSVYVRGLGTISSGSQPLYVVDGMPVNSDYDDMNDDNNYFDPMSAFNPNDIESVTVLKDAAATAIYGSRASNGVIVITTKKGGEGKFNVSLDIKQGFTSVANNNMKYANAEQTIDLFARGYAGVYTQLTFDQAREIMVDNFGWDGVSSYDWLGKVTRKGYYQDYNLSFYGSAGNTNYYVALGYLDTEGIVIGSDNLRYSGRVNIDTRYRHFTAGINASYSQSRNNSFSQSTSGTMSAPTVAAQSSMLPFYPFYNADGTDYYPVNYNPLAMSDPDLGDMNQVHNQTINANPWLRLSLPVGLWIKTSFGVNIMDQRQYNYWSAVYNPQGISYNGLGQQYNSNTTNIVWTNTLGWDYKFNDAHNISVLLGQEMIRRNYRYEYYMGTDFPFADSGMRDLSTCGAIESGEYYKSEYRLASYFADVHYDYSNRYYVSASYRRDGSSVFGSKKRWGNFWSVGAKWRITGEDFLADNNVLTNAALRVSYGTVGNQDISATAARGYYSAGYNYHGTPGMVPANISNPNLTWETSKKFDVGFDLSFIGRWHIVFDYYNDATHDALYQVPLSYTTGLASSYRNIGKIRNRGVELGINGTAFANRDVTINVFANLTHNQNKVIKLANGSIVGTYYIIEEGRPYHQFYLKEYAGVERETGRPLYYLNESGDETTTDYTAAAKRYVGSSDPKVFGAFGFNAKAYGVDLSMQFNYRLGAKVCDSGARFTGRGMSLRTPLADIAENSWTPENMDAKYPQYLYNDPQMSTSASSRFVMNANYLRLSNITVGYTLPQHLTRKAYMEKVRFYMNFDNVHTWTSGDFTGFNPDTYSSGVIAWQYPAVFTFTGGLQVTF